MEKIFSLLLLITFFNCVTSITRITVDSSSATTLNPSPGYANYFYIDNRSSRSYIYFYIKDKNYGLKYDNIQVCYTDSSPIDGSEYFKNCYNSDTSIKKYGTVSDGSTTYYLFKYSSSPYRDYLIVKYYVERSSGSLEVQASYSELNDLINSLIGTALSIVAIVFIVIGSVIVLSIIITILCCCCACCSCCARTTTVGAVGYVQPPPSVVISNPTAVPLVNQTPHYI